MKKRTTAILISVVALAVASFIIPLYPRVEIASTTTISTVTITSASTLPSIGANGAGAGQNDTNLAACTYTVTIQSGGQTTASIDTNTATKTTNVTTTVGFVTEIHSNPINSGVFWHYDETCTFIATK